MTPRLRTLYAVAVCLSSSLLFLLELVAGKRLLPLLGGSAAVWTTSLVFFQSALLLGYFVAHLLVTRVGARGQAIVYLSIVAVSLVQLLVASRLTLHASVENPVRSVLWMLTVLIGLPFVTLSVTSPLLQAWYARALHHATAQGFAAPPHPYRLFSISNLGSLAGLISFPWLIETHLGLHQQATMLAIGVLLLGVLCASLATSVRHVPLLPLHGEDAPLVVMEPVVDDPVADDVAPGNSFIPEAVWWILLSTCGSFLLSASTNFLNHSVTAPLLWTLPLVLYLLTFVIAFAADRWHPRWLTVSAGGIGLVAAVFLPGSLESSLSLSTLIAFTCLSLFGMCLFLHAELHRRRPPADRLTAFYLCIAGGGSLGAILVGVIAPSVLSGDYDLSVGLVFAALIGVMVAWSWGPVARIAAATMAAFVTVVVTLFSETFAGESLYQTRNFYGTLTVAQTPVVDGQIEVVSRELFHGTTLHGEEMFRIGVYEQPTTYYTRKSGVGLALTQCCGDQPRRIGAVGLGIGTLSAYGRPDDYIRYYEINPAVEAIAREYFSYLRHSPAKIDIVTGDARLSLAAEAPQRYNVVVIDAFSGDAIPVHLITAEALALYRRHLAPHGIIAFHISNNFLDLAPVVVQLATAAGMGSVFIRNAADFPRGVFPAEWVLVTDNQSFLNLPVIRTSASPVESIPGLRLWTDDDNTLLPILHFLRPSGQSATTKRSP